MDRRLRELERRRQQGGINEHAQYLAELVRYDVLEEKRLAAAAYFGHPAAKLAVPHLVKPTGIIWKDRLLPNRDIRDYLWSLEAFGFKVSWRAALAMARLGAAILNQDDFAPLISSLEAFVYSTTEDNRQALLRLTRQPIFHSYSYGDKRSHIHENVRHVCHAIARSHSAVPITVALAGAFKDQEIKKVIRKEIYPFLLGEYQ